MLHEACACYMAGFKWKYACDSHWPVYQENPHQLCFFASSISFTMFVASLTAYYVVLV